MLGKLFNLGSGGAPGAETSQGLSSRTISSLESVHEDLHTRNLLFPDAHALYQHRNDQVFPLSTGPPLPSTSGAGAYDYDGDIDLDPRHVRVIVMQDALGSVNASLLFDSHSPPAAQTASAERSASSVGGAGSQDPRRTPTSPRKSSLGQASRPLVIQPDSPQPRQGAFDRRGSMHGRTQTYVETESQRAVREYREELATFSSCIFANSELMAYKGTSTKVHVVPSEARMSEYSSSYIGDGRGSMGRSSMRSSRLAQSYSSEVVSPTMPPSFMSASASRHPDRKKVLITRLFPVLLPADDDTITTTTPSVMSPFSEDGSSFPFPATPEDAIPKKKRPQPKQKKTPMYAVVLVVQLPVNYPNIPPNTGKSVFRGPGSYNDQESFPSSFSPAGRSGWTMIGGGLPNDSFETSYSGEVEDRIDALTQHWDIIMRTLTHLQSVIATDLVDLLKQADIIAPEPYTSMVSSYVARTPSLQGRRAEEQQPIKPPKSNAKLVTLSPNALAQNRHVAREADAARTRLVAGLKATRVVTGQGRWGIWREEARWMARCSGGREHGFFFFNLLTGFLATHTDWLQALSPAWYRKRHFQQQKSKGEEDMSLPARTVIVAQDKMAARRLVFLLSAFLPANQQLPTVRTHRPSTSTSFGLLSHSPPSLIVPILREESLRRKINKRSGPRRGSHSRTVSQSTRGSGVPAQLAHLSMEGHHERRASDAASIRTSNLPIPGSDVVSRKSSAATTTTATPETPIAHLATAHRVDSRRRTRPGSSGSMAAEDLKRTLRRGESTGQSSIASTDSRSQSSRWGSVISGLWSAKRRDSTNLTTQTQRSAGSGGSNPASPRKPTFGRSDKLSEMVREVSMTEERRPAADAGREQANLGTSPETPRGFPEHPQDTFPAEVISQLQRTPDPAGAFESPVKTSINADDGVIDVDVPFPDYITSFETAVSSPSSSGYLSTPGFIGLEGFEQSSRPGADGDLPLNVAGWLQSYHADFTLQAIPPQDNLMDQVKASLRAEPSPAAWQAGVDQLAERWVDISSAIIADTVNLRITRIRYRRLIRPRMSFERLTPVASAGSAPSGGPLLTPSVKPYEQQLEEDWIEEQMVTLDDVLIEAVERVIAQSSDASKVSSSSSSRSNSKRRERSNSESTQPDETPVPAPAIAFALEPPQAEDQPQTPHASAGSHEVPRGECKTVVLSALSEIIRVVMEQREKELLEGLGRGGANRERESALREAVRVWLENVELGE